ncbi:MAG: PTS transporter subunit EIIC [Lachnospiraceae bacterium]|nr:PTS transporter subunit EIIC [Lachnospiraceae bacterium]
MKAKKNYDELAKNIIDKIGGSGNVVSLTHCVTRLRFKLADESIVDTAAVKNIKGVLTVVQAGGQYQVVIGSDVGDAFDAVNKILGSNSGSKGVNPEKESDEKKTPLSLVVDTVSGIFMPMLPAMMAAGLLKAFCAMLSTFGILSESTTTYTVLYVLGDAFFYFLPILLGAAAAKKFGLNQFLGMFIGTVFLYPDITALYKSGEAVTFMNIPVKLINYPQTVLPILAACFLLKYVDRVLKKIMPKVIANIFVPAIEMLITVPIALIVIGPVTDTIGTAIASGVTFLMTVAPPVTGFVVGGCWSLMIMLGLHFPLMMIEVNNLMTAGHMIMLPATFPVTFAHAGAALGVALRTKDPELKETGFSAFTSGILGTISEPAIYGVNLKYKTPFICASVCSGIGGAIIALAGADCIINLGGISIYTMAAFVSLLPGGIGILTGVLVGFFGSMITSFITFKDTYVSDKNDEKVVGSNSVSMSLQN